MRKGKLKLKNSGKSKREKEKLSGLGVKIKVKKKKKQNPFLSIVGVYKNTGQGSPRVEPLKKQRLDTGKAYAGGSKGNSVCVRKEETKTKEIKGGGGINEF